MSAYHTPTVSEIKNNRLRSELSQIECAHMCCVTVNTWSRWETGKYPMPAGMWKLYLIESERVIKAREQQDNEVNEENVVDLKQLSNGWD